MRLYAAAFLALLLPVAAFCGGRFGADTREFDNRNGGYRVKVEYSARGGAGPARLTLKDPSGKTVSVFETASAPFSVDVSSDGSRLVSFDGRWGQSVEITGLSVYSSEGKLLGNHAVSMVGPAGQGFSSDFSVYAAGADRGRTGAVYVLSAADGRLLWNRTFKEKLNGLKLSGDGKKLLIVFIAGDKRYRAALFDAAGRQYWEKLFATRNNLFPRSVSADGSSFELWEDRMIYREADGYYHDTLLLKRSFSAGPEGVRETGSKKVREDIK